jgi:hypothetical protein
MTAEQSAGTSTAEGRFSIGGGTTMSSRRALGYLHENGAAAAENDLVIEHDQAMAYPSTAGGLQSAYDFDEMPTIDGFRLIVDVAGGVASEWIGYLACGSPRRSLVLPNLHAAHHLLVR